jgi:DNA-binding NarL/FixJ family response regulator
MDMTHNEGVASMEAPAGMATPQRASFLTRRERQVVELVVEGCSNDDIASRLNLRPQTIKNQLTRIYVKTGVSSRLQLAIAVMRNGLVDAG